MEISGGCGFTKLSKVLAESNGNYFFECPGCGCPHGLNVGKNRGPAWSFSGDVDRPTFSPSVLVRFNQGPKEVVCHSFVRNGEIQFLNDCTHTLAGQTVPIPEWEIE